MLIFVSVLLFLNFPVASCEPINPGCSLGMADAIFQDGDVLVDCHFVLLTVSIALQKIFHFLRFHLSFPMFIYRIHPNKYQYVIALNFAIEEINKNIHLLPNISLGYDMYSIVQYQATILEHSIRFLTGLKEAIPNYTCRKESKLIAVVTGTSWEFPSRISTILGLYKYPQLTFGPFDPMLSDHVKFPFIYQMAPEDTSLALGMVSLMVHFSWTWVGLIITENEKGIKFLSDLKREMKKNSVCAAFVQMLSLKYRYNWNDLLSTDPAIMGEMTPLSVCSTSCAPGLMKSPQEGKASCCFDCHPCLENEISNETDSIQCIKCPDDQYANTEQTHCIPKAVTFLAYEDPLGMALACMALCFSALTALVLGVFVKHHETPIVKANNRTLSYILLISLILCFLCSLPFIGLPNMATCILQQMSFGVVFTIAVSTVLAKTVTVVLAFRSTVPGRRMRWILVSPNLIIPICTLIQMVLCAIWLGASAPFVDINAHNERGHITIMCNKGSATAFYCVLGYLGFLAMGTLTVAFWARNLPDIFNEAKFLTFSMLVFCSVWVTFLPVYHSTKGKVMVAVEVFSILASSAGLLGCIFVPKCYIILIRPKNGSFKGLRGTRVCK
uniref:Vomeronasal 2, receptor 120 n=1 Tax=Mus musculus TaxID=10090 RepID=A0A3Q4EHE9_MOUSE